MPKKPLQATDAWTSVKTSNAPLTKHAVQSLESVNTMVVQSTRSFVAEAGSVFRIGPILRLIDALVRV